MPLPCAWGHGPGVRLGRAGRAPPLLPSPPLPSAPLRSPPASTHARGRSPGDTARPAPRAAPRPPRAPRAGGAIFKRLPAGGRWVQGEPRGGGGEGNGNSNGNATATQRLRAPLSHTGFACMGTAGWVLPRLPAGAA